MKIEHIGYMVEDPPGVAAWYVGNLRFRVARAQEAPPFTTFLIDGAGNTMIEIYNNPAATVPNYREMDPLLFHLALEVGTEPITVARDRLLAAGAALIRDVLTTAAGDELVMLRDPWGLALQLVQRKERLV